MKNIIIQIFTVITLARRFVLTAVLGCSVVMLHAQLASPEKVKKDFISLLQRPAVDASPSFTSITTDSVVLEHGFFYSEATEKVPVLIYKPTIKTEKKLPVVICLHGTGGSKDDATIKQLLYEFSKSGFMAVAIDARYHGERVVKTEGRNFYVEAAISAWQNKDSKKQTHPFFYDTVYDLWKLVDYLITRADVDSNRIGMMGISMGGIETWMAASVDTRIKVAVPAISAQSFKWSLVSGLGQGSAKTSGAAHLGGANHRCYTALNKENVKALWDKILPGILNEFDCPSMIRLFAPRPLLLLSTEKDQNCPLGGAQLVFDAATNAYLTAAAADKIKIDIAANEPHRFIPKHMAMTIEWFKKWL
jgi:dienelactone hydrolase